MTELAARIAALQAAATDLVAEAAAVDPPDPGLVIRARQIADDVAELAADVFIAGEVG